MSGGSAEEKQAMLGSDKLPFISPFGRHGFKFQCPNALHWDQNSLMAIF